MPAPDGDLGDALVQQALDPGDGGADLGQGEQPPDPADLPLDPDSASGSPRSIALRISSASGLSSTSLRISASHISGSMERVTTWTGGSSPRTSLILRRSQKPRRRRARSGTSSRFAPSITSWLHGSGRHAGTRLRVNYTCLPGAVAVRERVVGAHRQALRVERPHVRVPFSGVV